MASCAYCNTTIIFGGKKVESYQFCNDRCFVKGRLLVAAEQLPAQEVTEFVRKLHQSRCPKCSGPGPIDVFTSYSVWSALVITRCTSQTGVSCAPCGKKSQMQAALLSLLVGWWGVPWGIIMTPVQIARNYFAMARARNLMQPSPELDRFARIEMAAQLLASPPNA